MEEHLLLHKWLGLSNPNSDDFAEVQAYMKVSIAVMRFGDKQILIEEEDEDDPKDPQIIMQPSLTPKFFQIKLRIFQGEKFPPMDFHHCILHDREKIDAYFALDFKGREFKTN